jgi:von Willebrand factor type A domain
MKASWTIAAAAGLSVGSLVGACGSSGARSSGAGTGSGGSGAGMASTVSSGTTTSSNGAGGLSFDAGDFDSAARDGDACGSVALDSMATPGNIVVVFDQSDSMNDPFTEADGGSAGPKYKVAEDALVAALEPQEALLRVGAIFFPTTATGNTCSLVDPIGTPPQIQIEPGKSFVSDFQGHFSATGWTLILGTPTVDALKAADTALPDPSPLEGARAVVILTDGAPTCDTAQADILAPVQDMFSRGIKTYAIGLPGSATAASLLDAIAQAGGTGTYLSPADQPTLEAALAQITSSTIDPCTIALSPAPPDPNEVYLIATDPAHPDGIVIPRVDGGDGWTLSSDGATATLTGAVCTAAKSGGYTTIQFVYGCPALPT